jgi:hypothetical protein
MQHCYDSPCDGVKLDAKLRVNVYDEEQFEKFLVVFSKT